LPGSTEKLRVDKWLWHARLFKSRGLAGEAATSGHLRVNGAKIDKASYAVKPGDVLTFPKAGYIRIIRIEALGARRGPAAEAQALYEDLDPPQPRPREEKLETATREAGSGRPTKRERREIDALKRRDP
jgi:ribosome-associated heat shock protein Hsp15